MIRALDNMLWCLAGVVIGNVMFAALMGYLPGQGCL